MSKNSSFKICLQYRKKWRPFFRSLEQMKFFKQLRYEYLHKVGQK